MVSQTTIITGSICTVALLAGGYAIYFDYKRRNDPEFRKAIKREQKRLASVQKEKEREEAEGFEQHITRAYKKCKETTLPTSPEEREQAFMQEVAKGEQLYGQGKQNAIESAVCFFKALRMYPQPAELIKIYEQTVPDVWTSSARNLADLIIVGVRDHTQTEAEGRRCRRFV